MIKDEKGASSVLVIILMIVLIILGLAIATTSISNINLSKKKTSWLTDYYELNMQAQQKLNTIDKIISSTKLSSNSDKQYRELLEKNFSDNDILFAMPYNQPTGDCTVKFSIKKQGSEYNKRINVSLLVPLKKINTDDYYIIEYRLLQDSLVKDQPDEFVDPFEHIVE